MAIIERSPEEVWSFFQRKKDSLQTVFDRIASNSDVGVEIYISADMHGKELLPCITVFQDDDELYSETAVDATDCENTVKKFYLEYLPTENVVNRMLEKEEEEQFQLESDVREDELQTLTSEYITNLLDERFDYVVGADEAYEITVDVLDHVCEYLYRKHHLSPRRPMTLEDEDGKEFHEEYPYECMEYDDPDNPLYKK